MKNPQTLSPTEKTVNKKLYRQKTADVNAYIDRVVGRSLAWNFYQGFSAILLKMVFFSQILYLHGGFLYF